MMKRARTVSLLLLALPAINFLSTNAAHADCASEIQAVRAAIAAVKDGHRRQELIWLLDKAEKDNEAGRDHLCDDAIQHARALLKS